MDNGTPALFRQGLPAGMRLAIFASLSVVLMLVDGKMQTLEAFRESILCDPSRGSGDGGDC